jgi:hypothetical protein
MTCRLHLHPRHPQGTATRIRKLSRCAFAIVSNEITHMKPKWRWIGLHPSLAVGARERVGSARSKESVELIQLVDSMGIYFIKDPSSDARMLDRWLGWASICRRRGLACAHMTVSNSGSGERDSYQSRWSHGRWRSCNGLPVWLQRSKCIVTALEGPESEGPDASGQAGSKKE